MDRFARALVAFALMVAACSTGTTTEPDSTATPGSGATTGVTGEVPAGTPATVVNVFDGDSFEADVDGRVVEVRMLGINAPEGFECHGNAARTRLRELLDDRDVVLVADGEDDTDRFGRLLRSVYADNLFVNATLVAEGHVVALQGGAPAEADLVALSDDAFTSRLGMWAPTACDESSLPTVNISGVEYDPAGRDFENKEEEWVVVINDGDAPVDLSGWILRDESSSHRYEFGNGDTLEPGAELRIRTGCGEDRQAERYWCADDAVWSNGGDTVILQTSAGTVIDRVRYEGNF